MELDFHGKDDPKHQQPELSSSLNISREASALELQLPPGFRFHPTDEELVIHYLTRKLASNSFRPLPIVTEVDLYKFDPWDLPQQAKFGDKEWYFFSPRDRKYPNGVRPNRAAASGYWKATGTDKLIHSSADGRKIGVKKALVFYKGRAPKGTKSNWIMHEYRLVDPENKPLLSRKRGSLRLDDWVLCRLYKKKARGYEKIKGATKSDSGRGSGNSLEEQIMASLPDLGNASCSTRPGGGDAFAQLADRKENSASQILNLSLQMMRSSSRQQQQQREQGEAIFNSAGSSRGWQLGNILTEEQQNRRSRSDVSAMNSSGEAGQSPTSRELLSKLQERPIPNLEQDFQRRQQLNMQNFPQKQAMLDDFISAAFLHQIDA